MPIVQCHAADKEELRLNSGPFDLNQYSQLLLLFLFSCLYFFMLKYNATKDYHVYFSTGKNFLKCQN